MPTHEPVTELDARYGDEGAQPTNWTETRAALEAADLYWVTTVRPDGRPHVTPLIAVWRDHAMYFCTGPHEQKAHNLAANPQVALVTGCNVREPGTDLVVEGTAVRVTDEARLRILADAWVEKYGEEWRFDVAGDGFRHTSGAGEAWVFEVAPTTAYGFGKEPYSQTRYRFDG